MDKIISILGFLFIFVELMVIIFTYYCLAKQYKYAMNSYYKKQHERPKYVVISQRNTTPQAIVVSNETEIINDQEVENELNYPVLYFYVNNKEIESVSLWEDKIFIGRSKSDDIVINEPTVSRSQCYITHETDKYFINIDRVRNPIMINHKQINKGKKELSNGDRISMGNGKVSFVFST